MPGPSASVQRTTDWELVGVVALAFALRCAGLARPVWLDEQFTLDCIQAAGLRGTWLRAVGDAHPPLYFFLLKLWSVASATIPFLRLASAATGAVTVLVTMLWLRRESRLAALLAGLFFATNPFQLRYGVELRGYGLLTLATAAGFLFASRALERPRSAGPYVGLSASATAAVAIHLSGSFVVPVLLAYLWIADRTARVLRWPWTLAALAVPGLVTVVQTVVLRSAIGIRPADWWMPEVSAALLASQARELAGVPAGAPTLLAVATAALAVAAIVRAPPRGPRLALLVAGLLFWAQVVGYSVAVTPIAWPRTLLPSLVPLVAAFALSVAALRAGTLRRACIASLVAASVLWSGAWLAGGAVRPVEDWAGLGGRVATLWRPGMPVTAYPSYVSRTVQRFAPAVPPAAFRAVPIGALAATRDDAATLPPPDREAAAGEILVLRVDLRVRRDLATLDRLLARSTRRAGGGPVTVLLLTSTDVGVVPDLAATREHVLDRIAAAFAPSRAAVLDRGTFLEVSLPPEPVSHASARRSRSTNNPRSRPSFP